MEKLFGIPIAQLTIILLAIFAVGLTIIIIIALRNTAILKIAVRNIPRRRAQTLLIVLGLMLATLLFSASFTTGDTFTHSIRVEGVKSLGEVDVLVRAEEKTASGSLTYFDERYYQQVQNTLSDVAEVDGVALLVRESVPVIASNNRLSEPQVDILGYDNESMNGFDVLQNVSGGTLTANALAEGQVYISKELAESLEVSSGDIVQIYLGPQPANLEVAAIYKSGASPAGELSIVMPLVQIQSLMGSANKINMIMITNRGDSVSGAAYTGLVLAKLDPVLKGSGLEVVPIKQDTLEQAEASGNMFSSIFLLFGQFSIVSGIVLIFLIFVMLAAERKRELGIMRAMGAQRSHIIRLFTIEGTIYSLIAAAVGSLIGVAVGWGMVRIMSIAFGQSGLELSYSFNWRSVIIAYTLGMAFTFTIVLISSWQVSRLNIIRAIRDITEPRQNRKTVKGLVMVILLLALGSIIALAGFHGAQTSAWMLGISLVFVSICLLARRFGLADRAAFTAAGLGLLLWWIIPNGTLGALGKETTSGIELLTISGIMVVLGGVLVIIYNMDLLLKATVFVFGHIRGLTPVLKTAVSYPMQSKFRTGATLVMFSLVVFVLVVMAFVLNSSASVYKNTGQLSGGFDIRANTSYINPIIDIHSDLEKTSGVNDDDFTVIGSVSSARVQAMQEGTDQELVDILIQGTDTDYANNTTYGFLMTSHDYNQPEEVWQALMQEPDTIIVPSSLVPSRNNYSFGGTSSSFKLEGIWQEDKVLPDIYLQIIDPATGTGHKLRVIGVLKNSAIYVQGICASQQTVNTILGQTIPPTTYMFKLKDATKAETITKVLKAGFLENGLQAYVMADEIKKNGSTNMMLNNLLQGFMGLGLVVGIAALGVIAARSVIERRQQIGVLRALGFQKNMVQLSFLLESSFVAILGIMIGVVLGVGISVQAVTEMTKGMSSITFEIPWSSIVTVIVVAYGASLLTTYLPARQASRIYPAEALRFE
jgi:putative ABC transport system permease protein